MLIDWFTVVAQALNFLVLVWLLKRFAYAPILGVINEREKRIAAQLADAAAKSAAATLERDSFEHKNSELEQQRTALMAKAQTDAKAESQRLLEATRQQVAALDSRLQEALHKQQLDLRGEITRRIRDEVFSMARKTLSDLATQSLEETMLRVFIERVRGLSEADRSLLKAAMAESGKVIVRGAFEFSADARQNLETVVAGICGKPVPLVFEIVPELISGVELTVGGRRLAWSIADHLAAMEAGAAADVATS
jgi:F-type H+-transporting ATPase subunit b